MKLIMDKQREKQFKILVVLFSILLAVVEQGRTVSLRKLFLSFSFDNQSYVNVFEQAN